jgi:hypothetical protein
LRRWAECGAYIGAGGGGYLLDEAHEEDLGLLVCPLVLEKVLGLGAGMVVGRLELLEQLGQLSADLGREERHVGEWWWWWWCCQRERRRDATEGKSGFPGTLSPSRGK